MKRARPTHAAKVGLAVGRRIVTRCGLALRLERARVAPPKEATCRNCRRVLEAAARRSSAREDGRQARLDFRCVDRLLEVPAPPSTFREV